MRAPSPNQNTLRGHSWKSEQATFASYTMGCMARVSSRDPCVFTVYQKLRLQLIQDDYRDGDKAKAGAAIKSIINNTNEFLAVSDGPEASKLQGGRAGSSKSLAGLDVPDDELAELALAQGFDKVIAMARMCCRMTLAFKKITPGDPSQLFFTEEGKIVSLRCPSLALFADIAAAAAAGPQALT